MKKFYALDAGDWITFWAGIFLVFFAKEKFSLSLTDAIFVAVMIAMTAACTKVRGRLIQAVFMAFVMMLAVLPTLLNLFMRELIVLMAILIASGDLKRHAIQEERVAKLSPKETGTIARKCKELSGLGWDPRVPTYFKKEAQFLRNKLDDLLENATIYEDVMSDVGAFFIKYDKYLQQQGR